VVVCVVSLQTYQLTTTITWHILGDCLFDASKDVIVALGHET
jgi:hypothetical protein